MNPRDLILVPALAAALATPAATVAQQPPEPPVIGLPRVPLRLRIGQVGNELDPGRYGFAKLLAKAFGHDDNDVLCADGDGLYGGVTVFRAVDHIDVVTVFVVAVFVVTVSSSI